jgi:hypothetical protein
MERGIRVGMSGAGGGIAPQERSQGGDFKGAAGGCGNLSQLDHPSFLAFQSFF